MWPRGPVGQTGLTLSTEPSHPPMGTLPRDTELLGDMGDRTAVPKHPLNEQTTTMQVQPGVSVGHEDLLGQRKT